MDMKGRWLDSLRLEKRRIDDEIKKLEQVVDVMPDRVPTTAQVTLIRLQVAVLRSLSSVYDERILEVRTWK